MFGRTWGSMLEVELGNVYGSSLDLVFFCSLAPCYMYFKSAQKNATSFKIGCAKCACSMGACCNPKIHWKQVNFLCLKSLGNQKRNSSNKNTGEFFAKTTWSSISIILEVQVIWERWKFAEEKCRWCSCCQLHWSEPLLLHESGQSRTAGMDPH